MNLFPAAAKPRPNLRAVLTSRRRNQHASSSFTEVENSWPQVSQHQKWRTWLRLTNSDAAGANTRSLHLGHAGRSIRRDATELVCVSACPIIEASSACPPSRHPCACGDCSRSLSTAWRADECFLKLHAGDHQRAVASHSSRWQARAGEKVTRARRDARSIGSADADRASDALHRDKPERLALHRFGGPAGAWLHPAAAPQQSAPPSRRDRTSRAMTGGPVGSQGNCKAIE
jgi:hypothetical protein